MNDIQHLPHDGNYVHKDFPFASTGPNGETEIVNSEAETKPGWTLPGGKTKGASKPKVEPTSTTAPATPKTPASPAPQLVGDEFDAAGTAWNPALHAATRTKTKAGLWRMRVGVTRPEGQDVPKVLDL